MTKQHLHLLVCGLALSLFGCKTLQKAIPAGKEKSIVVLYENDVHCATENYAKLAGLRDAVADTAYVALVSSGDYLQGGTAGAISTGQYVIDVMKECGYDAVTIGNHEFDYKMPRMIELLRQLGSTPITTNHPYSHMQSGNIGQPPPVTCVNLCDSKTNKELYRPYILKQLGNKKIAFVGATTPTARKTEEYAFVDKDYNELYNLSPDSLTDLIQKAVNNARQAGADYVVLLAHLGEEKNEFNSDSHSIARQTTGIDVVLDGHTHSEIIGDTVHNKTGQTVVISQTGTKLKNIGKLVITPNGTITTELVPTSQLTRENEKVKRAYTITCEKSSNFTEQVIGDNETLLLVRDNGKKVIRLRETNAGDFVADAVMDYCKSDITMVNAGSIRTNLPSGEVTNGGIMDLAPYDNRLTVVEETGAKIVELLTACIQSLPNADGDFPQVAGLRFEIDGTNHTVSNVMVMNKSTRQYEPIKPDQLYTIGTTDYTVKGGGFKGLLRHSKIVREDNKTMSDMVALYLKYTLKGHIGKEYAEPQGRINLKY
ncbi:MAG: bifunctional metallophosphatase/5'-nucleotidase [Paludibacteraceae bacterium]|nr:bifunctional metallophosphatase/5'-nucleotidase [Paludibacteraceae bacterium]